MDEEAYKIMANIKYSTSYLFLDRTQKELIKRYMKRYEALHGIRAASNNKFEPTRK